MDEKLRVALETLGWSHFALADEWSYKNDPSGTALSTSEVWGWVARNEQRIVKAWLVVHPRSTPGEIAIAGRFSRVSVNKTLKLLLTRNEATFDGQGRGTKWSAVG